MTIVVLVAYVLAGIVLIPATVLFLQVIMALPARQSRAMPQYKRPAVAVLIPAHNEANVIAETIRTILPQLGPGDRLLVVADNCTDDTASIGLKAGAEVIERTDPERRGKGYALEFGVRHLERQPPEVVIVIDADCQVAPNGLDYLAKLSRLNLRPVQALYLMRSPAAGALNVRIAEFAWLIKNQVRPSGYDRLGLPCQLMGTGMAIPWSFVSAMHLGGGHLVEDLMLGLDLARRGGPPLFCPEVTVTSVFPRGAEELESQRVRWEHGHLGLILQAGPRMFAEALARRDMKLLSLLLDLCVPPLALLAAIAFAALCVNAAISLLTDSVGPVWLVVAAVGMLISAIVLSWGRYGRAVISLKDLALTPLYALRKLPLYIRFFTRRQIEWVRTKR